jgi:signal transduction histidine kinase/ligand-binding sensor domain-containing protein/DNA-binding response OmpR family regulator
MLYKNLVRKFLQLFIFCSAAVCANAQSKDLNFLHLTTEMGVSNSECKMIVQDKEGFIWIGTADGLNRYDGINFRIYRKIIHDSTSLQDNHITALFVDSNGELWIGTNRGGLSKYIKENDTFITFKTKDEDITTISDNSVTGITEDRRNRIWVSTYRGLNLYDRISNKFTRFQENPKVTVDADGISKLSSGILPSDLLKCLAGHYGDTLQFDKLLLNLITLVHKDTVSKYTDKIKTALNFFPNSRAIANIELKTICTDDNGKIIIGYYGSIISIFNPDTRIFCHYPITTPDGKSIPDYSVNTICSDDKKLWIGTLGGGAWIFDTDNNTWRKFDLPNHIIIKIMKNSQGDLFFGSHDGLIYFDRRSNTIKQYNHDENDKYSISSNSIVDIYEDKQNNLWIGENLGAIDLYVKKIPFRYYNQSRGLTYNNVSAVMEEDENNLWVGYFSGGVDIINRKTLEKISFRYNRESETSLGESSVHCIFKDKKSNIWIGTYRGGLQMYDKLNNRFITYRNNPADSNSISENDIRRITEDSEGNLWIATQDGGVNKFDPRKKIFKHYKADNLKIGKSICSDWVFTVYCDESDNIWVGTSDGLSCLNINGAVIKNYTQIPGNYKSLSNNFVLSVCQDSRGNMWFGTREGLNLLEPKTGTFTVFTVKDGLPNDIITGIVEDDQENLWISTFRGLSKFSLKDYTFTNFDRANGLETDEFLNPGGFKNNKGEFFFGGRQGLIYFVPDEIEFNNYKPPVYFTDFKIFNKSVSIGTSSNQTDFHLEKQITYLDNIILNHNQNNFTFEFAALNYIFSEKNQYAYRLEGFNSESSEWNYINFKHDVTFTNLPHGNYILHVKASNNDGIWNESGASIKIRINPPWWSTIWAKSLYILVVILLLIWFRYSILQRAKYRSNLEYARIEAKKEQEMVLMKLRFFSNITHEFRTPLTLILGPVEKLLGSAAGEIEKLQYNLIYRNATRLLRLINQLMDFRKMEAGEIKLEVTQNDIIDFVFETADVFNFEAQERKIDYKVISGQETLQVWFDNDKLDKILYNLISNAFKFTPDGGRIIVKIQNKKEKLTSGGSTSDYVEITIEDSGIGIPQESLSRIFERFYQAENSPAGRGTGIGLALTKELVELHQGRITVERNTSGGARFSVYLPLGKEHFENYQLSEKNVQQDYTLVSHLSEDLGPEGTEIMINADSPVPQKLPILLIVEDNADLRLFIKNEFKECFKVLEAKDGIEGFDMAAERIPDLIISDVMMPKMEGFELCKKLKTDERTCHIPIIMLTALSAEEKVVIGLETGADDYIVKPFSLSVLKARVHNLIESRQLLRKQFSKYGEISASVVMPTNLDQNFLQRVFEQVEKHISDSGYDAHQLAAEMNVSRSLLYKKIQALTGLSVHEFIRNIRLRNAAALLKSKNYNVTETAIEVGFNDLSYFIKCFTRQYGITPSKYSPSQNKADSSL